MNKTLISSRMGKTVAAGAAASFILAGSAQALQLPAPTNIHVDSYMFTNGNQVLLNVSWTDIPTPPTNTAWGYIASDTVGGVSHSSGTGPVANARLVGFLNATNVLSVLSSCNGVNSTNNPTAKFYIGQYNYPAAPSNLQITGEQLEVPASSTNSYTIGLQWIHSPIRGINPNNCGYVVNVYEMTNKSTPKNLVLKRQVGTGYTDRANIGGILAGHNYMFSVEMHNVGIVGPQSEKIFKHGATPNPESKINSITPYNMSGNVQGQVALEVTLEVPQSPYTTNYTYGMLKRSPDLSKNLGQWEVIGITYLPKVPTQNFNEAKVPFADLMAPKEKAFYSFEQTNINPFE